jgi:DNA-binding GntR family transcriptional regulator
LREVAALRQLIERDALQRSIVSGDLDWEGAVVSAHHKLATIEEKMIAGDPIDMRQWRRFDREFHTALISASHSSFMFKLHSDIFDHFLRYQMIAMGFRGRPAAEEHLAIMKHALARRTPEAVAVLTEHIELGVQEAIARGPLAAADSA